MDRLTTAIKKFLLLCVWALVIIVVAIYITQKPNDAADFVKGLLSFIGDFIGGLLSIGKALAE